MQTSALTTAFRSLLGGVLLLGAVTAAHAQPGGRPTKPSGSKPTAPPPQPYQEAPAPVTAPSNRPAATNATNATGREAHANVEQRALELFADSLMKLAPLSRLQFVMLDTLATTKGSYAQIAACFVDRQFEPMVNLERTGQLDRLIVKPVRLYVPPGMARDLPAKPSDNLRIVKAYGHVMQKNGDRITTLLLLSALTDDFTVVTISTDEQGRLTRWCTTETAQ